MSPNGVVTFLFTDIEGSTKLWERSPEQMAVALARHNALLRKAAEDHGGEVFKTIGDAFCMAFATSSDALAAALSAQKMLVAEPWPEQAPISVRMALHTGSPEVQTDDYFGQTVNRVARLLSIAHGQQIVVSGATALAAGAHMPSGASLLDRGSHRLKDLQEPEKVFQLIHSELPSQFPPLRSLSSHPNNLPQQLTSFVGRANEMTEVKLLLGRTRLLTLTGAGGCGKTRMGIHLAADLIESYSDGVWLVELAALTDPELVPKTVASALEVREQLGSSVTFALVQHLQPRHLLLLLDNAEHLRDACAQFVEAVLRQCGNILVVVTSRERLGVTGELTYRVPPLTMPDPKRDLSPEGLAAYESVRLFVERAQFHLPQFAITHRNASAVASICARVDGIPLAIELAAARARSLSVEELDRQLDDRFRVLTGGSRTALPRQQTLRSMIDWSFDLLQPLEKTLFQRMAVFAGGCTLDAAARVCCGEGIEDWEVLDLITSLSDKSLVFLEERSGATRFRMLETVRQYASERLRQSGSEQQWREQHVRYFVDLAEQAEPQLRGADQRACLDRLDIEHDNLRAALSCGIAGADRALSLRLTGALWRFWLMRGHVTEGRGHLMASLSATASETSQARAKALAGAGILAFEHGDYAAARRLCQESVALQESLGDKAGLALSLNLLGSLASIKSDYASARDLFERSLAIRRELGDLGGVAASMTNLGLVAVERGDFKSAQAIYQESLSIARQLRDQQGINNLLINLGIVACLQDDLASAQVLFEESLAICRELGHRADVARSLDRLAFVACERGAITHARPLLAESLAIRRDLGHPQGISESLVAIADFAYASGELAQAGCIWGSAERLREQIGGSMPPSEAPRHERCVAAARASERKFDEAWQRGRAMTLEQAIAFAATVTEATPADGPVASAATRGGEPDTVPRGHGAHR